MSYEEERQKYEAIERDYHDLKDLVRDRINWELEKADIRVHAVYGRVKSFRSYYGKLKRMSDSMVSHDALVADIAGVRVVCLFLSQLDVIHDIIQDVFNVLSEDRKLDHVGPDTFGYQSNHYVVSLRESYAHTDLWRMDDLPCEIQVRTLAMEAWASISHAVDYKSAHELPADVRRDLHAMSALLYVADRQFQQLIEAIDALPRNSTSTSTEDPDFLLHELNMDTLSALLQRLYPTSRQPDRETTAALLAQLREAQFKLVGPLKKALEEGQQRPWATEEYDRLQHSDAAYVAAHHLRRADWSFSRIHSRDEEKRQDDERQAQSDSEQRGGQVT